MPTVSSETPISEAAAARAARLLEDVRARKARSAAGPLFVELSANNFCNLRCAFCYGAGKPAPSELTPEQHEHLLDALLPGADVVIPSAGSEPFLGDLERTLAAVRRHGNRLLLITSGYYLTEEWCEVLAPFLYRLQISLDSHVGETYEELRAGSDFERVSRNLKTAARMLGERGLSHRLVVSAVATSKNFHELPAMIEEVRTWGAEVFLIQQLYEGNGKFSHLLLEEKYSQEQIEEGRAAIAEAAKRAGAEVMIASLPVQLHAHRGEDAAPVEWDPEHTRALLGELPGACYQAFEWMKVTPDGSVYPCCVAPEELRIGNALKGDPQKLYHARRWRALRKGFLKGKMPGVCESCTLRQQYVGWVK